MADNKYTSRLSMQRDLATMYEPDIHMELYIDRIRVVNVSITIEPSEASQSTRNP